MPAASEDFELPADRIAAIRAFYESHPYPAPVASLEKRLDRYRDPRRRRAQNLHAVAIGEAARGEIDPRRWMRNVAGRAACAHGASRARDRDRRQRNELAPFPRSPGEARHKKFAPSPAGDRACRRTRRDIRPDRLHRRPSPPERPRCRTSLAARRPRARRRDAHHGLCALWARRHLDPRASRRIWSVPSRHNRVRR